MGIWLGILIKKKKKKTYAAQNNLWNNQNL